ncbi:hypothetical protein KC19_7G128600 [Ceratodon purpureus]|uniref:Uncharacterized protein n=1 Tax=Ceratodon purpureus TaxID=3225 RepID=A0A8T0HAF7_CERPU|nr:hypothetical protein KC19_7G128600 [Ceratodon purpureus]
MDIACLVFFYHDFKLLTTSVSLGLRRYCVSTYVISFFTCACRSTVNNCMVESPNLKRMCASTAENSSQANAILCKRITDRLASKAEHAARDQVST